VSTAASYDAIPDAYKVDKMWLDGELVDAATTGISIMTWTLHYGVGAFEGIRAYDGALGPAVFRLREHIERLFRSARLIRSEPPFTVDDVVKGCLDTLAANGMREGYLRPILFVDDGKRGLAALKNRVRVAVIVWPWGAYLGEEGMRKGIRAQVAGWTRMSPRSFLPKGKICGQYVNSVLAKRDAVLAGLDEAILLDDQGYVAEASGENIFMVREGVLRTPPKSAPILEGITRDSILTLARDSGIRVKEERFSRDALFSADEVFLTGTAAEVTPVREIDGRKIGIGQRGPVTEQLQTRYLDVVRGRVEPFRHWLSPYTV
jgi:branched-chain amino acid aminotransferase